MISAVAEHCPTDFIVWEYNGSRLTLRGGRASSQWSDLEISFEEVIYMSLPVTIDVATLKLGDQAARKRVEAYCDVLDENSLVFELIEEPWIRPDGTKTDPVRHVIVAEGIALKSPAG